MIWNPVGGEMPHAVQLPAQTICYLHGTHLHCLRQLFIILDDPVLCLCHCYHMVWLFRGEGKQVPPVHQDSSTSPPSHIGCAHAQGRMEPECTAECGRGKRPGHRSSMQHGSSWTVSLNRPQSNLPGTVWAQVGHVHYATIMIA